MNEEMLMTTPKNQWHPVQQQRQQQQQHAHLENESYTDTIREEWKTNHSSEVVVVSPTNIAASGMNDSAQQQQHQEQLPQSPQEIANVTSSQSNHDCNQQHTTSTIVATSSPPMGSPKYLEMKAELQQMLVEVTELTPHKKEQEAVMMSPLVLTTDASMSENDGVGAGAAAAVANDLDNTKAKDDVAVEATKTTTRKSNNNSKKLFTPSPSATSHNSFSYSPSSTTSIPQYSHNQQSHQQQQHHLHSSSISSLPPVDQERGHCIMHVH